MWARITDSETLTWLLNTAIKTHFITYFWAGFPEHFLLQRTALQQIKGIYTKKVKMQTFKLFAKLPVLHHVWEICEFKKNNYPTFFSIFCSFHSNTDHFPHLCCFTLGDIHSINASLLYHFRVLLLYRVHNSLTQIDKIEQECLAKICGGPVK